MLWNEKVKSFKERSNLLEIYSEDIVGHLFAKDLFWGLLTT